MLSQLYSINLSHPSEENDNKNFVRNEKKRYILSQNNKKIQIIASFL